MNGITDTTTKFFLVFDDLLLLQKHLTNVKMLSFRQRFLFRTPNQHDLNKRQQRVCLDYGWPTS